MASPEAPVEHELKIPVAALDGLRVLLVELGGAPTTARGREQNWVLDDADGTLRAAGRLLRVRRRGGRSWLTFKDTPGFADGVKSRVELESEVSDADTVLALLARLGFRMTRRYEKVRETWRLDDVEVALDETPMGAFVELEGDAPALATVARRLGLDPSRAVRGSYLALWDAYRREHPEAPADMVLP